MLKTGQYFSSFYGPNGLQDELKKAEDSQLHKVIGTIHHGSFQMLQQLFMK